MSATGDTRFGLAAKRARAKLPTGPPSQDKAHKSWDPDGVYTWVLSLGLFQPSSTASVDNGVDRSTIIEGDQGQLKGDIECLHTFVCPHCCVSMRVLRILRGLDTRSGQFFLG